ncbi:MAG: hypothetical protein A4E35_01248 [Methanoregula sp. PtaU1.Bin051]|nr:MAG: hypothetical protein A4E35_01248 [Methanoregula sp. PtaU1.Bin051]
MERLNDDAQWIVLMGFLVSFALFFLAYVLSQSTVVGQTTAEGVLEFPKNDIRDFRHVVFRYSDTGWGGEINADITALSLARKNAIVSYMIQPPPPESVYDTIIIHYSNGVTVFNETAFY